MTQRNKGYATFIKIFIALWVFMVFNIIALMIYLHWEPAPTNNIPSKNISSNIPLKQESSNSALKSFYLQLNQHNTYLNPINIHNESVIYELLQRILTQNSDSNTNKDTNHTINNIISKFNFQLSSLLCKSSDIKYGCYKITENNINNINIYGNNIGSIISGLSYYLSTYWTISISWNGNNINTLFDNKNFENILNTLSNNNIDIYASRNFEYTYYKNPCTDSYSMVWWDWNRWEKEIDWMILQNINLLLLPTLNELIEYELYTTHYGLTDYDLKQYFVGPAFLAWFRMGNLRGWPPYINKNNKQQMIGLTQHWFKQQLILTYKTI
eukprot:173915_1